MGKRSKFGAEQLVVILRQIEVAVANGKTTALACKEAATPSRRTIAGARSTVACRSIRLVV
jgi:hypothetical protein